jgi:hypothetical protein
MAMPKLTTTDREKAQAFAYYAMDTEGMSFTVLHSGQKYTVAPSPGTNYIPQVVSALIRNFNQEYFG